MESEGSLSCSQDLAIYPHSEPDASSPQLVLYFPNSIILPSTPRSSEWSLPVTFSDQNFVRISHFMRATYPANLILLPLITLIIFGKAHKL